MNFRQKVFRHVPGPMRSSFSFGVRHFWAADTPYGLVLNVEPELTEQAMAGNTTTEFIHKLAQSNLPDLTVANLALNLLNIAETLSEHSKFLLNGLVSIQNPIDVPLVAGNCNQWYWELDAGYRQVNEIPDSVVEEWEIKYAKFQEEQRVKEAELEAKLDEIQAYVSAKVHLSHCTTCRFSRIMKQDKCEAGKKLFEMLFLDKDYKMLTEAKSLR